jgi:ribosomal protein S18 acetylase RimI-like enzyme
MTDTLIRTAEPADADAIAALHVASWRDSHRGMIPDAVLDGPMLDERLPMWRQVLAVTQAGRLVLVATTRASSREADPEAAPEVGAPPRLLGFTSAGRRRGHWAAGGSFDAEIYTLYVAQASRGRHLGCRLIASAAIRLQLFGHASVMLWTLAANAPARAFYERLGGEPAGQREERFAGALLDEVGYGWPRIETLLEACSDRLAIADAA